MTFEFSTILYTVFTCTTTKLYFLPKKKKTMDDLMLCHMVSFLCLALEH